jgi:NADPH:quinone reductase-like Zn-dependent oxidoreductase
VSLQTSSPEESDGSVRCQLRSKIRNQRFSTSAARPAIRPDIDFGAKEFVDLDNDALEDVGEVDLVFDVIGGDIAKRSAGLIRAGGTLVSIVEPPEARPTDGLAVDFVVVSDRAQLNEIVQRVRDGPLQTNIGNVSTVDDG